MFMGATVFEVAGVSDRLPPLVLGVGTKRLGKGRVKMFNCSHAVAQKNSNDAFLEII